MLAEIIIAAMGRVTWDTSKILSGQIWFNSVVSQLVTIFADRIRIPSIKSIQCPHLADAGGHKKFIFLMILGHFFFRVSQTLCDLGQQTDFGQNHQPCDR